MSEVIEEWKAMESVTGVDLLSVREVFKILKNFLNSQSPFEISMSGHSYRSLIRDSRAEAFLLAIGFIDDVTLLKCVDGSKFASWVEELATVIEIFEKLFFEDLEMKYLGAVLDSGEYIFGEGKFLDDDRISPSTRFDVGFVSVTGKRDTNEDEVVVLGMGPSMQRNEDYFAVYDGHGGQMTAKFLSHTLHHALKLKDELDEETIDDCFIELNEEVLETITDDSGSTSVVVYIIDNIIHVANCGDSRAVMGKKDCEAERITEDHKPENSEFVRIYNLGGTIQNYGGIRRVEGNLSMSRAFGDRELQPYIIADPYIEEIELTDDLNFLILACDGLWDAISDQDAVNLVSLTDNPKTAANQLKDRALADGSDDNISIIVVFLKHPNDW